MLASISTLNCNWIIYKVLQKRRMKTRGKHFKLLLSSVHSSLNFDWGRAKHCNGTDFLFLHSFLTCKTLIISGAPHPFLRPRKDLRRFIESFARGLDNFQCLTACKSIAGSCRLRPHVSRRRRHTHSETLIMRACSQDTHWKEESPQSYWVASSELIGQYWHYQAQVFLPQRIIGSRKLDGAQPSSSWISTSHHPPLLLRITCTMSPSYRSIILSVVAW